jgi:hypothetical protein
MIDNEIINIDRNGRNSRNEFSVKQRRNLLEILKLRILSLKDNSLIKKMKKDIARNKTSQKMQ